MQLRGAKYVNLVVKERDKKMQALADNIPRRFVKVAPPTVHGGIGDALRQAFRMEGELRSRRRFEELLASLD
jgi:hypothetical protein